MKIEYELSAIFSKGQLLQVGDIVDTKEESLGRMGFEYSHGSGYISKIISESDIIVNSGYLNLSLGYCTNKGLGNKIYLNDSDNYVYAFECSLPKYPNYMTYFNEYFNISHNKQKRDYLLWFLKVKRNIMVENNYYNTRLGYFIFRYASDIYKYLQVTLQIRTGKFDKLNEDNLSNITFRELKKEFGEICQTTNVVHLLIDAKSEFTKGKLFIKGKEEYYEKD